MKTQQGLTLVELMITLAIATILVTMGVPAMGNMMDANRSAAYINQLSSALQMARHQAYKQRRTMVVCPANNSGDDCGTDWNQPLLIFADSAGGNLIRQVEILPAGFELKWTPPSGFNHDYIAFGADGSTAAADLNPSDGKLTLCHNSNDLEKARGLSLNLPGRVQVAQDSTGSGIRDFDGDALSCS